MEFIIRSPGRLKLDGYLECLEKIHQQRIASLRKAASVVIEEYFGVPMAIIILNACRSIVSG